MNIKLPSSRIFRETLLQNPSYLQTIMRLASALVLTALIVISPVYSADQYQISGKATYSDGASVIFEEVEIQCEENEYDCHEFRGVSDRTDAYGYYQISINIDDSYDGAELILILLNENTSHIIDISEMEQSPSGTVREDINLRQSSPKPPVFSGIGCGILVLSLAFAVILVRTARRLSTPEGRLEFVGYKAPITVDCPDCDYKVEQHLLIRHLIVDHDYDAFDAGELAGEVFRGTWSPSEEQIDGAEDRI